MDLFFIRSCVVVLGGVVLVACSGAPPSATSKVQSTSADGDASALAEGRRWTEAFYARRTEDLWGHLGPELRKLFGDAKGLEAFREQVESQLGPETRILEETITREGDATVYTRIAAFTKRPEPIRVVVAVAHEVIVGFGVKPAGKLAEAPTTRLDYQTRAPLRLPFDGAWSVAWGGRTVADNAHAVTRDQRFAYDFFIRENGATHRGEGKDNADYYCHGRPILAPAAGRVVAIEDGRPENVPGRMDAAHPAGNYVVLEHGDGEYSLLAHLVPGSIAVAPDQRVAAGQVLGRCGNSGHSSEPHLHYHLQSTPALGDAEGLPAQFHDYVADGNVVSRGEPRRGQTIRAQR